MEKIRCWRRWAEKAVIAIFGTVLAVMCGMKAEWDAEKWDWEIRDAGSSVVETMDTNENVDQNAHRTPDQVPYDDEQIPRVALTFDDGPSEYTKELSQGLKERGVQATFFLLGVNMEGKEEAVKQLAEDGHLLGNHSYHHVQLNKLSETKACQEIVKTNNLIYEYTGIYPMYVRPPYGEWDTKLDCGVDMIPVFWNVDSLDWKLKNTDQIVKKVMEQVEDGDIILMHDGYSTSVEAAFRIVDTLQEEGYQFVTADKMLVD